MRFLSLLAGTCLRSGTANAQAEPARVEARIDFNADGHESLVVAGDATPTVTIGGATVRFDIGDSAHQQSRAGHYPSEGAGDFAAPEIISGQDGLQNFIIAVGVGDTNRDGFDDVVITHGEEIRLHFGSARGLQPGQLVHWREHASDGIAVGRADRAWWWVDSDAGEAYRVRFGRRPRVRRVALR